MIVGSIVSNRFDIVVAVPAARRTRARRPTLRDVATLAGVSTSTASLAFSRKGPVAPETAERVRAAAAQLSYAGPDPLASSLRHGRVGTVAVIVEGRLMTAFRDPYAITVLDGLAQELDDAGMGMLLIAEPPDDPEGAVTQLGRHAVDAAAFPLCSRSDTPLVAHLRARGIPMVSAGSPVADDIVVITTDDAAAIRRAAEYVRKLGHVRVAHIAMPLRTRRTTTLHSPGQVAAALATARYPDAAQRLAGFLTVFGSEAAVAEAAEADVPSGQAAAGLLLDLPERPTAIIAQSDLLAVGAIRAAEERGLRVPGDLSVTGFDGVDLPWLDHRLTTVVQPGEVKGRRIGQALRVLAAGERAHSHTFAVTLRVGTTTGPPPAGALT